MGSLLLLAFTRSSVLLGRGSEKTFNECLGVSNIYPSAASKSKFGFLVNVMVMFPHHVWIPFISKACIQAPIV